jgi:retinol dehydrogenase-12
MAGVSQIWSQMFPPTPEFTEKECPDLLGKVLSPPLSYLSTVDQPRFRMLGLHYHRWVLRCRFRIGQDSVILTPTSPSLAKCLSHSKSANVYIAGRSKEKGKESIELARATAPSSTGRLEFLYLDLADLSTIAKSAEQFLSRETRLDVLWNNAGVMKPPAGSRTKQVRMATSSPNLNSVLSRKLKILTP